MEQNEEYPSLLEENHQINMKNLLLALSFILTFSILLTSCRSNKTSSNSLTIQQSNSPFYQTIVEHPEDFTFLTEESSKKGLYTSDDNMIYGSGWLYTEILNEPLFVYQDYNQETELYDIYTYKNSQKELLLSRFDSPTNGSLYLDAQLANSNEGRVGYLQSKVQNDGKAYYHSLTEPGKKLAFLYNTQDCKTDLSFTLKQEHLLRFQRYPCNDETPLIELDGESLEHPFFDTVSTSSFSIENPFFSPDFKSIILNYSDQESNKHYVLSWNLETQQKEAYELFAYSAQDIVYSFTSAEWIKEDENYSLNKESTEKNVHRYKLVPYDQVTEDSNREIVFEGEKVRWIKETGESWECNYTFEKINGSPYTLPSNYDGTCLYNTLGWIELGPNEDYLYYTVYEENYFTIYSYHFATGTREALVSLYNTTEGINHFIWSPSNNKLAFEVVNQHSDEYPTYMKIFVLTIEEGRSIAKQKYDISAFTSCANNRCSGVFEDFKFIDENTIQYRARNEEEWEPGELEILKIQ